MLHCVRFLSSRDDWGMGEDLGAVPIAQCFLEGIWASTDRGNYEGTGTHLSCIPKGNCIHSVVWVCVCGDIHSSSVISWWPSRFPAFSFYLFSWISNFLALLCFSKAFIPLSRGSFQSLLTADDPWPSRRGAFSHSLLFPFCLPACGRGLPAAWGSLSPHHSWPLPEVRQQKQKLSCSHFKLH